VARNARQPKAKPDPYPPGWEPFLAAINAHLDADVPRLMFADWLQENGDEARAEFIRLQIRLHNEQPSDANRAERIRELELQHAHRERWQAGFPDWCQRGSYRRGFRFHVSATARQWIKDGAEVRRLTPLAHLTLSRTVDNESVFAQPSLLGLHRLFLDDPRGDCFAALADAPALDSLSGLTITDCRAAPGALRHTASILGRSSRFANLARVWVNNAPIGDAFVHGLASNPVVRNLIEADFLATGLSAPWLEQFLNSPVAKELRTLNLQANSFGDGGTLRLVNSPLTELTELKLSHTNLTAESARLLAAWPGLKSVRTLQLGGNEFGFDGCRVLLMSEHIRNVSKLWLPTLRVHKTDRERLATLPQYQRIAEVTFG
jgi:uncharacterized protein (TIGR02996 family)